MFRAIRNRWIFGRPIYVWKAWVPDRPGLVTLGFTENSRGNPLFEKNRGWSRFGEPGTFPFGFATDRDYIRRNNSWCRINIMKMTMEVRQNGFYIAPPQMLLLLRLSTYQAFPHPDGSGDEMFVVRWAYVWADQDRSLLPEQIDGRPILDPWRVDKSLDIAHSNDRAACDFWHIQYDLEIFKYHIEPYKPKPVVTEEDKAKAEQEKFAALEQQRLNAIELERKQALKNEQRKAEWPYNAGWWPKNAFQMTLFTAVLFVFTLFVCALTGILSGGSFTVFLITILLTLVPPFIAAGPFNPYFYEAAPLPPEPSPPSPPPIRKRLEERLRAAIMEHDYAIPPPEAMRVILSVGEVICNTPRTTPHTGPRPGEAGDQQLAWDALQAKWEKADELVFEAVVQSLSAYISHLPTFDSAPFTMRLGNTSVSGSIINDIMRPFTFNEPLRELGLAKTLTDRFNANVGAYTQSVKNPLKTLWPQRYQGKPEDIVPTYLQGTPLQTLFDVLVPYQPFSELNRCAHHWCLGGTRKGKSTFLRHLIKHDLEEAAKGNCSVVVIDSKGLIREMRTLQQFAPGSPLDGNVVIIDSERPFPLNPFKLPNAAEAVSYMLATMTDASQLQTGALRWYVEATLQMPNPSLATLQELTRIDHDPKKGHLPAGVDFSKEVRGWFASTRPRIAPATSSGIAQRLDNFMRDHKDGLMRMFNADSWAAGHNLMDDLHNGGKVLLVDTDWEANRAEGAEILGRLFIAFIEQLSTRRMEITETYKPVWVYIDEASDYLKADSHFTQIMIKAAGQKIGLTVAYQFKGFIDRTIELALEKNAEIKSTCSQRGTVDLVVEERPLTLPIDKLEFKDEPQMGRKEYARLREWMAFAYPYKHSPKSRDDESEAPMTQKF